jgi:HEAT repeat protein
MTSTLHDLVCQWENWAKTASQDEDGWQADFPAWDQLIQAAIRAMQHDTFTAESLKDVERCWAISEEGEDLADFARQHLDACWPVLQQLVHSPNASVRWQVYDVLGDAGPRAEPLLRAGLEDPDSYAKRRAILALARLHPADAGRLATRFADDADPYIRLAASTLSES